MAAPKIGGTCRLCFRGLVLVPYRRNFFLQEDVFLLAKRFKLGRNSEDRQLHFPLISLRKIHSATRKWQFSHHYLPSSTTRPHASNYLKISSLLQFQMMNFSSSKSILEEDLEDIKNLLQKRLSDVQDSSKKVLLLEIVDELIKQTLNPEEPHKYYELVSAAQSEDLYALATKVYSLQDTVGEEAEKLSVPLFRTAALQGDINAKYSYGQLLFRGAGGLSADPIEAAQMFIELAKLGHPNAQFTLAGMYYAGIGLNQDFDTAYTLYQVAGENGVKESFNSLGKLYLNGEGVEQNEEKAFEYFMEGADAGDVQAMMSVGHCYSHGKGVERNFDQSFVYHKKAADLGYPPGLYNVGTHYFAGKGIGIDMTLAAEYFQKAADLGFTLAEVNLGNMYYQGLGIERDVEKARQLYKRAAPKHRNARLLLEELEQEEEKNQKSKARRDERDEWQKS